MIIEQNTNYAYKLKYMDNPTFDKVRDLAIKFMRELPKQLQDELYEALNRGVDILDSEPQMVTYLYAFGPMHQAKLNYAFKQLPEEFLEQPEINIIDYGCGQALGTMCYADFLRENCYSQKVKTITLIEPSEICMKRAALHASVFFADAEIKTVNKSFDKLEEDDIYCEEHIPTLHILSNVLDMLRFDLDRFAELVKDCLKGVNQFVCVGPYFKNYERDNRMKEFVSHFCNEAYGETMDKGEFYSGKDWTCSILLCSNSIKQSIIGQDCDKVCEKADLSLKNNGNELVYENCIPPTIIEKAILRSSSFQVWWTHAMGVSYLKEKDINENLLKAICFFTKAAQLGYEASIVKIIELYTNKEGIEYFGDEQYDVIVKAAQLCMKEALPVLLTGNYSASSKLSINDWPYSCEKTYSSLIKTINDNNKHDDSRFDGLSETLDASFVFNVIKNISLPPNKKLGFFRELEWNHYTPGNSMFPYVYDSNVNIHELNIRNDYVAPSNGVTATMCEESFWEIFLLDNLKYFLPKFDHANYMTRHIVFPSNNSILPEKITKHIKKNHIDLTPIIDCLFDKIIRVQCFYYNAWSGLNKWTDYYLFQETKEDCMNVTRLNNFSNQTEVLYKYDCGIKF